MIMGMCAEIIAVGPFLKKLSDDLEYGTKLRENTKEGSIITECLFGITEGSSTSREFAALLGITDPWDFNQHHIKNEKVDLKGLDEFCSRYKEYKSDFETFKKLMESGFEFHFRPNG